MALGGSLLLFGAQALVAQNSPVLLVSSTSLNFQAGLGENPTSQSVFVGSSGAGLTLQVTTTTTNGGSWLQYSSDSGVSPANLTVAPQTSTLPSGTYQGQIQISAAGASNSPLTINVSVTVGGPGPSELTAAPAVLNFVVQLNGNPPPAQSIKLSSSGSSVGYTVNVSTGGTSAQWLVVTPAAGSTPSVLDVNVNAQGLTGGTYNGTINIAPNAEGSGGVSVQVNLTVNALPTLNVSPLQGFEFYFQSATVSVPPIQGLTLSTSAGTLSMGIQATTGNGIPWLSIGQSQAIVGTAAIQVPIAISPIVATMQPGTYSGALVITAPGASNPSVAVPVTLLISTLPLMSLGNPPNTFTYVAGVPRPQPQNVSVGVSSGQLQYSTTVILPPGQNWLTITPDSGVLPTSLSISVDPTGLSSGTYSGQVQVTSAGAANSPLTFPVTMTVSANGLITVSPSLLNFNYEIGQASPASQSLNLGTTGGTATYNLSTRTNSCGGSWLSATPVTGSVPATVQVSVNSAGMATQGLCTGTVVIVNQTGVQTLVPVNLNVSANPLLNVTPSIMNFTGPTGGSAPATQNIQLAGTDPGTPIFYTTQFSTTNGGNWLTIANNGSGRTPASIPISVDQGTLLPGSYTGVVQIVPAGLPPIQVQINLVVTSNVSLGVSPPSLSFATVAGVSPGPQALSVVALGGTLPFSAAAVSNFNWLSVTPASGNTPGQLIVTANTTGLAPATYAGTITISSTQASNPALVVPVSLTVGAAQNLTVDQTALTFNYFTGDPAPATQTINLTPLNGSLDFTAAAQINGSGTWLSVTPANGTAPGAISVTVDPTNLAPALYSGTITITPVGLAPIVVTVSFSISGPPLPSLTAVLNAGSMAEGAVAPGEIVILTGVNTGPAGDPVTAQPNADGTLPLSVGNTQVFFDTFQAPILQVQNNQVMTIVPFEIAGQTSTLVQVQRNAVYSNPFLVQVTPNAPGVFTTTIPTLNVGAITNADGTPNTTDNPAAAGTTLTIYYTGEGVTDPPTASNTVNPAMPPFPAPLALLTATIGGTDAPVTTYGPAPGMIAGLSMATITVPSGTAGGPLPLILTSGTGTSPGTLLVFVTN